MLAQIGTKKDLARKNYFYEPKLDGTRAIAYCNGRSSVSLVNRRDRDITFRYPEIEAELKSLQINAVLDGEIIVYDKNGLPNFNLLQKREQISRKILIEIRSRQIPATYAIFDILKLNKKNLISLPLTERKKILESAINESRYIEIIPHTEDGRKLWKQVTKLKMEGVMAKPKNSRYYPGQRQKVWLKIKFLKTIDCIIAGFTQEIRVISALCLAVYDKGKLRYIGRVGTGFTEEFLKELHKELIKLKQKSPPVFNPPAKEGITWLRPEVVCEIEYLEISKDKILRAPSFQRLRFDKPPKECTLNGQGS